MTFKKITVTRFF